MARDLFDDDYLCAKCGSDRIGVVGTIDLNSGAVIENDGDAWCYGCMDNGELGHKPELVLRVDYNEKKTEG